MLTYSVLSRLSSILTAAAAAISLTMYHQRAFRAFSLAQCNRSKEEDKNLSYRNKYVPAGQQMPWQELRHSVICLQRGPERRESQ